MRVESEGSLVDLEAEDGCYKAGGDGRVKSKQQAENWVALTGCREPSWELPDYCDPDVINRFGPNGRKFHLPLNFSACFRPCRPARKLPRPSSNEQPSLKTTTFNCRKDDVFTFYSFYATQPGKLDANAHLGNRPMNSFFISCTNPRKKTTDGTRTFLEPGSLSSTDSSSRPIYFLPPPHRHMPIYTNYLP